MNELAQLLIKERKYKSRGRISYSELKIWNECSFKHMLSYFEEILPFTGNEYTAFGTAIHSVCEILIVDEHVDAKKFFREYFLKELRTLKSSGYDLNPSMIREMKLQGENICQYILPSVKDTFGKYEILSIEEKLMEDIDMFESGGMKFKGFIDLVLKTEDGKIHIIDWKTCSWGWDMKRRTDPIATYQLTLYKYFYAKKYDMSPEHIETHFALLKRTAKKENAEIFRVTSGDRKTKNAMSLLERAIKNINAENFIKNRLSCSRCQYYKTEHCPG